MANRIARQLVTLPHRQGGQAQYIEQPVPQLSCVGRLVEVLEWAREHLSEPITLDMLASVAKMSRRTFTRRFRVTTGTIVTKWLNDERVARAQPEQKQHAHSLLEKADKSCMIGNLIKESGVKITITGKATT